MSLLFFFFNFAARLGGGWLMRHPGRFAPVIIWYYSFNFLTSLCVLVPGLIFSGSQISLIKPACYLLFFFLH